MTTRPAAGAAGTCGYFSGHCPRCLKPADLLAGTAFCTACRIYCHVESVCTRWECDELELLATVARFGMTPVDDWIHLDTCGEPGCMP